MRVMTTRYRVRLHSIDPWTTGLPNSPETVIGDDLERQCIAETPKDHTEAPKGNSPTLFIVLQRLGL